MRLLAESEQNGGEKGKSVRFSTQRASPERAVCVCVVANSLSFFVGEQKNTQKGTKRREKERDSNARCRVNSQLPCNFDFS